MLKSVTAFSAALILGAALVGSPTTADAKGYKSGGYGGKGCCGPIRPTTSYSTKKVHKHVRVYSDVWKKKYVKRIKLHTHITRVQPIIHVHKVVRHHTKIVGVVVPIKKYRTVYLPPKKYVTTKHVHLKPVCSCSSGGYGGYGGYKVKAKY